MADENRRPGTDSSDEAENRDPLSGRPGAHPLGTGVGSAAGGAAGAGLGSVVAGPIGAVVGGVVGAVLGAAAGHAASEVAIPTDTAAEEAYWRERFPTRPYYRATDSYDDWAPAYRLGCEAARRPDLSDRDFDGAEKELGHDWNRYKGTSRHSWDEVREAARDSWNRIRGTT